MALTLANLGTATASTATQQTFSRTVTPSDDSVVYYCVSARAGSTPGTPTASDTSGATWSVVGNRAQSPMRTVVFRAKFSGTSPGSITVTVDWGANVSACSQGLIQATGADLTTPEAVAATTLSGTSTGPNVGTLSGLVSANNGRLIVVGHARGTADATPEGGWTERFDVATATTASGICAATLTGSDDTTPTYTLGSSVVWMAIAIEVSAAVTTLTVSATGSELTTASGTPTYSGVFNAFRGLVLVWP